MAIYLHPRRSFFGGIYLTFIVEGAATYVPISRHNDKRVETYYIHDVGRIHEIELVTIQESYQGDTYYAAGVFIQIKSLPKSRGKPCVLQA